MKKILYFFVLVTALCSCKKDESGVFNVQVQSDLITFTAFPGGATMHYSLPDNKNIYSIRAKYHDYAGNSLTVEGSYLNDSINLFGFVEETNDVSVSICYLNAAENASPSIIKQFNTKKCAAKAIFEKLEVNSFWKGFSVKYEAPTNTDGFIHIAKKVINSQTNKESLKILSSMPIHSGVNNLRFTNTIDDDNNTDVVVWSEDYFGNNVDRKEFNDVPALFDEIINANNFIFSGSSEEDEERGVGAQYLFDGDTKGTRRFECQGAKNYSFISQPEATPGFYTIEMNEDVTFSRVRFYCPLNTTVGWPWYWWERRPENRMPNHIKIYASNDLNAPINDWNVMGEFFESENNHVTNRWYYPLVDQNYQYGSLSELQAADPCFIEILFDYSLHEYKYLKIEVISTFRNTAYGDTFDNLDNRVTFHELEIYNKKD